jgi:hypothetical protein
VLAAPLSLLPLIYNMKCRMSCNPFLPNKFQVCQLDIPFQLAKKNMGDGGSLTKSFDFHIWSVRSRQTVAAPNVYVDGMLRSLLTAARQPSVEDSLGEIQARLLHAGSRRDGPP